MRSHSGYDTTEAMSPLEAARFEDSAWDDPLYTTSNSWIEVNYTQLVENARSLLPKIKPGSIALAMVKASATLAPCTPPAVTEGSSRMDSALRSRVLGNKFSRSLLCPCAKHICVASRFCSY